MKRYTVPALLALLLISLPGRADVQHSTKRPAHERNLAQVRRLVQSVPTPRELADFTALFQRRETPQNRQRFEQARQRLQTAEAQIPRLFALLKPGARLADYPGLREAGHFEADLSIAGSKGKTTLGYWLRVGGAPLKYSETAPTEFIVRLNKKGVITDVDDLVCRR